ncbi:Wadjet anti-phage system protein JetD domain-containing protein [uncultured Oscillibacter sp.]|uniref:Wadjet anti-phage system protein JetD domain-containing protein n=1 Tax=uncultured Oscillibacter sp. TaxID=876091 RepID=UPI002639CED5|nr:Wadjet anti-phage system protein JetD domain-containing protein [uncultured Oscillibacter sp.]
MEQGIILTRLLDKYEKSKHLLEPGSSNRRVMLRIEKKELPEYKYETASIRDAFNQAAQELEQKQLISAEWLKGRPVLSVVILNLDQVERCYQMTGRTHPRRQVEIVEQMVQSALDGVETAWIAAWRDNICANANDACTVPGYCRKDTGFLVDLLSALVQYDFLHGEPITMRAFSSKCYHNSKTFEREVRDTFLRIAEKFHPGLAEACEHTDMGLRDKLAYLGIYARPELYELSGNCAFTMPAGTVNVGATYPYGIALPSTAVDSITKIDLSDVQSIIFIENKTNYDEYLLSELKPDTLAVYHGGFLSPQKRKLFSKIRDAVSKGTQTFFWADIDLGGFQMYAHLQEIFPGVQPMRMSGEDVAEYSHNGLKRPVKYLRQLEQVLAEGTYPIFESAICEILNRGVTIEQESFLS